MFGTAGCMAGCAVGFVIVGVVDCVVDFAGGEVGTVVGTVGGVTSAADFVVAVVGCEVDAIRCGVGVIACVVGVIACVVNVMSCVIRAVGGTVLLCCFLLAGLPRLRGEVSLGLNVMSGKLQLSPSPRHMLDGMMGPPYDLSQDANSSQLGFNSIFTVPNTMPSPDTCLGSRGTRTIFLVDKTEAPSSWLFNCRFSASFSCLTVISASLACPRGDCLIAVLAPLLLFTLVDDGGGDKMSVCGLAFLVRGETCRVSWSGCTCGLDRRLDRGLLAMGDLMVETGDKLVAMLPQLSTVMLYTTCGDCCETGTQEGA